MEAQALFDGTLKHLRAQGQRCQDSNGSCLYLDESSGRMCGIGCHIPRDLYDPRIEGLGIRQILEFNYALRVLGILDIPVIRFLRRELGAHAELAGQLQRAHDVSQTWIEHGILAPFDWQHEMETIMRETAFLFGLHY